MKSLTACSLFTLPLFSESGCNPMATGIMSDIFPEEKRALVMAIFNWGIYGGYGIAFPVGRYITKLNLLDLVSGEFNDDF